MKRSSKFPLRIKGSLLLIALNWMQYLKTFDVVDKIIVSPPSSNRWGFTADAERIRCVLNKAFYLGIESQHGLYVYTVTGIHRSSWRALHRLLLDNEGVLAQAELDVGGYFKEDPGEAEFGSELTTEGRFRLFLTQLEDGRLTLAELMAGPDETAETEEVVDC